MTTQQKNSKQVKPRSKPQRFVRVIHREAIGVVVLLTIKTARTVKAQVYIVEPISADFGLAFRVEKEDETAYHVNLSTDGIQCDCRGHGSHGHCKHADFCRALVAAGELDGTTREDDYPRAGLDLL
jgi:hypothetical protein